MYVPINLVVLDGEVAVPWTCNPLKQDWTPTPGP